MKPTTKILHERLIRHAKGIISAWEEWLNEEVNDKKIVSPQVVKKKKQ